MKLGDIILVHGTGFYGAVIGGIEHSIYCHTAGIVKDNEIIEAQGFQTTNYEGLDKYNGQADVFTCDILTDEQRDKIVKYAEKEVGSHYDWLLLFWEALRYLFHITLPYKEYHNHICSTLWNDAYKSVGIYLCPGIKYPSPSDLSESKLLRKVSTL